MLNSVPSRPCCERSGRYPSPHGTICAVALLALLIASNTTRAEPPLYRMRANGASEIFWSNVRLAPNAKTEAIQVTGSGTIKRFWCTTLPKDAKTNDRLGRALVVHLYWDGAKKPAVSVPLADFFCQPLHLQAIDNRFFTASNHLCVFNSSIPMPFRNGFRLEIENGTDEKVPFWYGLDVERGAIEANDLYLHAYWSRQERATANDEITVLPTVTGKGRYLGTHWALRQPKPDDKWRWYGRPVRIYRDVETTAERPSMLIGTLDDFVCSGWWSMETDRRAYASPFTGRPLVQTEPNGDLSVVFYRYHVDDPLWFQKKFTLIAGKHVEYAKQPLPPVADGDWSTTAFFYLDQPTSTLPAIQESKLRTAGF
jgi:hypothetical protein